MKKLFLALGIIVLLLIGAALVAPYFITADKIKGPLIAKIQAMTGRTLTVDGEFKIRFFPVAGVTMENVTFSNPANYGTAPAFITLKSLNVGVAVLPLLHEAIEVKNLELEEPHINLHVNKNGVKNWLFTEAGTAPPKATPANKAAASPVSLPRNVRLNNIKLTDGTVSYQDETAQSSWTIDKLNASTSLNGLDEPLDVNADAEWNQKAVKVKATVDSLQSLLSHQRTQIDAHVISDLVTLETSGIMQNQDYTGKANLSSSSLKALQAWLQPAAKPLPTPAPLALSLTSDVACSAQQCSATNANLSLDKIQAKGSVKLVMSGAKPNIAVNLTSGVLDFNPFLPPEQHADAGSFWLRDAQADANGWSTAPIDLTALRMVDMTASIQTDGIVYRKITIGKTLLRANLQGGRLVADVVDAVMYGGKGNVTLSADASGAVPSLQSKVKMAGVQLEPLLKDVVDMNRVSGTADIDLVTMSQGASQKEMISSLAGNGQFKLSNGAIKGINLADVTKNVTSALKLSDNAAQKTMISAMNGSFTIMQGVVSNKDLVMEAAPLHMTGQGDINLPAQTINYRLSPQVAKEGVSVPVIIQGSLNSPSFQPDVSSMVQDALKDPKKFREQLKNSGGSLKDQLKNPKDSVKDLKGLLKGF